MNLSYEYDIFLEILKISSDILKFLLFRFKSFLEADASPESTIILSIDTVWYRVLKTPIINVKYSLKIHVQCRLDLKEATNSNKIKNNIYLILKLPEKE